MRMIMFNGPGLGTEEGARNRLAKVAGLLKNSKAFVATQDGRFYPVAVMHTDDMHNARHVADHGIYVTN
jgi:hypothetical protein